MRKCCERKATKRESILETVELVDKLVSHKIKNINVVLTVLMTIITSIIAYFITIKIKENNIDFFGLCVCYSIVVFLVLIWAHFPVVSRSINKTKKKNLKGDFSPDNLKYSAYLSDTDFCKEYEKFFNCRLTQKEKISVLLLKNKINELRFRTNCLAYVFCLVIIGSIITIMLLLIGVVVMK